MFQNGFAEIILKHNFSRLEIWHWAKGPTQCESHWIQTCPGTSRLLGDLQTYEGEALDWWCVYLYRFGSRLSKNKARCLAAWRNGRIIASDRLIQLQFACRRSHRTNIYNVCQRLMAHSGSSCSVFFSEFEFLRHTLLQYSISSVFFSVVCVSGSLALMHF